MNRQPIDLKQVYADIGAFQERFAQLDAEAAEYYQNLFGEPRSDEIASYAYEYITGFLDFGVGATELYRKEVGYER